MEEAESDAVAWSHWIQDAEPNMLRGKHCFSCTSASEWDPVHSGLLASASDDNSVRLWQIAADDQREISRQTGVCNGHKDSVLRVSWHSEGQILASGAYGICRQMQRRHSDLSHCNKFSFLQLRLIQQLSCGISHPRQQTLVQGHLMATSSKHCRYLANQA